MTRFYVGFAYVKRAPCPFFDISCGAGLAPMTALKPTGLSSIQGATRRTLYSQACRCGHDLYLPRIFGLIGNVSLPSKSNKHISITPYFEF